MAVTHSKQTTAAFLSGARTACQPAHPERLFRTSQGAFREESVCSAAFLPGSGRYV